MFKLTTSSKLAFSLGLTFVCNVCPRQSRASAAQDFLNDVGKDANVAVLDFDSLNHRDGPCILGNLTLKLSTHTRNELQQSGERGVGGWSKRSALVSGGIGAPLLLLDLPDEAAQR